MQAEARAAQATLLAAAKAGDRRAFGELLGPYRQRLWGVCYRITGNRDDAEDALQDALIAVWQNLAGFRGDANISTWAYRIASNAALALVRKRREYTYDEPIDEPDPRSAFEERVADRDRVQAALAQLPEAFRVAIVLREFGDQTYEQIAEYQQVPVQTVKSRLNRARSQLKALLAPGEAG